MKLITKFLVVLATISLMGCGTDEPFSEGSDYRIVTHGQKSKSNQVVLYFSAACPHCFAFDKVFEQWVEHKQGDIVVERIPVQFGHQSWKDLQRAYATLRILNLQDELTLKMFEAIQEKNIYLGDERSVIAWLSSLGNSPEEVRRVYNSNEVLALKEAYSASEGKYQIRGIPYLIVNGIYQINIKKLGSDEKEQLKKLTELISYLMNKE